MEDDVREVLGKTNIQNCGKMAMDERELLSKPKLAKNRSVER